MARAPEQELYELLSKAEASKKPSAPSEGSAVEKDMEKAEPDFKTPVSLRNLFTHHETHPLVLYFALIKALGPQWVTWESETVFSEVSRIFKTQVSEHNRAKVLALKACLLVDSPWQSWQVFEKVLHAFNGNIPRWDIMQALSLGELMAGVDILDSLRRQEFGDEVRLYAGATVLHEDVFYCPPPLDVFQAEVSRPHWECLDCGSRDSALFHDGVCDTCSGKFDPEKGLSMTPDPGKGRNTKLVVTFDPDPVQARWELVATIATEKVELDETQADIQVAKLLLARDYTNILRRQLAEQLVSLKSWLGA